MQKAGWDRSQGGKKWARTKQISLICLIISCWFLKKMGAKNVPIYKALDPWDPLPWNKALIFCDPVSINEQLEEPGVSCRAQSKVLVPIPQLKKRKNPWSPTSGSLHMLFSIPGINYSLPQNIPSGLWFCFLQKSSPTLSHLHLTPPVCSHNPLHLLSCGASPVHCGEILK